MLIEDETERKVMSAWWIHSADSAPVPASSEDAALMYANDMTGLGRAVDLVEVVVTRRRFVAFVEPPRKGEGGLK